MARNTGAGHNSGDHDDETLAQVQLSFSAKIRLQEKEAAKAKAVYDAERDKVNRLFSQARGILGYTRKEFEEVLAAQDMDEEEFLAAEAKRAKRFQLQGLPMGAQLDMFDAGSTKREADAADDQGRAYASGLRAGRRGDEREMPNTISPVFMNDWLQGYDAGQDELGKAFIRHNEVEAAKNAKKPVLTEEKPDEEEEEELTEAAIAAGVKRVKNSDFMKPSEAETTFAEPAAA